MCVHVKKNIVSIWFPTFLRLSLMRNFSLKNATNMIFSLKTLLIITEFYWQSFSINIFYIYSLKYTIVLKLIPLLRLTWLVFLVFLIRLPFHHPNIHNTDSKSCKWQMLKQKRNVPCSWSSQVKAVCFKNCMLKLSKKTFDVHDN